MVSTNSSLLLAGGLGLLIGVGGGATGALLVDRDHGPAMLPAVNAEAGASSAAIAALTTEIRNLRESIGASSSQAPAAGELRTPATDPATERLERAIAKLTEVLESPRANPVRSSSSATVEHQRIPPKQVAVLEELRVMNPSERIRAYFFWSLQDVLDRFGKADGFYPQEGQRCSLHYDLGDGRAVDIQFTSGMVYEISGN